MQLVGGGRIGQELARRAFTLLTPQSHVQTINETKINRVTDGNMLRIHLISPDLEMEERGRAQ